MKNTKAVLIKPSTCMVLYILVEPASDLLIRHWKYIDNLAVSYVDTIDSAMDMQTMVTALYFSVMVGAPDTHW